MSDSITLNLLFKRYIYIFTAPPLPTFNRVDISASALTRNANRHIYGAFSLPVYYDTFIPNERLNCLTNEYKSLRPNDLNVMGVELLFREQLRTIISWELPECGSASSITNSTVRAYLSAINMRVNSGRGTVVSNDTVAMDLKMAGSCSDPQYRIQSLQYPSDIVLGSGAIGTESSPFAALIHCFHLCVDAALHLLERGLRRTDCVVPGIVSCRDCLQICAVYLMPESYPVITWLSPLLMIACLQDRIELSRWAICLAKFAADTVDLLNALPSYSTKAVSIALASKLVFKQVREYALDADGNLDVGNGSTAHSRLDMMMRVYQRLSVIEGSDKCILFPCGIIGNPTADADKYSAGIRLAVEKCQRDYFSGVKLDAFRPLVVFEELSGNDGWSTVRPPSHLVAAYLEKLQLAVHVLNTAEVAHMDLRPTNIICREIDGAKDIELRVIDFESSVPFDIAIEQPSALRYDARYPVLFEDERTVIPACANHNVWFLNAITAWLNGDDNTIEFGSFMIANRAAFEDALRGAQQSELERDNHQESDTYTGHKRAAGASAVTTGPTRVQRTTTE
jgi:hypothetical protein